MNDAGAGIRRRAGKAAEVNSDEIVSDPVAIDRERERGRASLWLSPTRCWPASAEIGLE